MGCDIHMHVELNVPWIHNNELRNRWKPVHQYTEVEVTYDSTQRIENGWYDGRNYDEFAILAGVRNGYGFAGIDTGQGFIPLAYPKGLPDDVSSEVEYESQRWGVDGHSHSWLTLRELRADDKYWALTTTKRGVVTKEQAAAYRDRGEHPTDWCGDITPFPYDTHERLEWEITYADHARYLREGLIPRLEHLTSFWVLGRLITRDVRAWLDINYADAEGHGTGAHRFYTDPDNVRVVFWFDN